MCLYVTHAIWTLQSHDLSGEAINSRSHTFLTTQGHGGPPWMRDQLNAEATSEKSQTWKTIHIIHAHIHSNKGNMKGWLWRPNEIWELRGSTTSRHLSYRRRKTPKNFTQETCPNRGSIPGPLRDRRRDYLWVGLWSWRIKWLK